MPGPGPLFSMIMLVFGSGFLFLDFEIQGVVLNRLRATTTEDKFTSPGGIDVSTGGNDLVGDSDNVGGSWVSCDLKLNKIVNCHESCFLHGNVKSTISVVVVSTFKS